MDYQYYQALINASADHCEMLLNRLDNAPDDENTLKKIQSIRNKIKFEKRELEKLYNKYVKNQEKKL